MDRMSPWRRRGAVAGMTAALLVGGGAGALMFTPAVTLAQEADSPTTTAPGEAVDGHRHPLEIAAEVLGVEVDDLAQRLRDGDTIADVAAEVGVDVGDVVDAIVEAKTAELEARIAELPDRVTAMVNGEAPLRGPGHRGHHGPHGPRPDRSADGSGDDGADGTTTTVEGSVFEA